MFALANAMLTRKIHSLCLANKVSSELLRRSDYGALITTTYRKKAKMTNKARAQR